MKIPDFMKNDITKLNLEDDGGLGNESKVSIQGRIRKSTYYIIARGIKFGLDTKYLI